MGLLTRDQILQLEDRNSEIVQVPEWGGEVKVVALSGAQRDAYEMQMLKASDGGKTLDNLRARLVAASVVDEKGKPLFNANDIVALGNKSAAALDRIFTVAQRLSAFSDKDVDEVLGN